MRIQLLLISILLSAAFLPVSAQNVSFDTTIFKRFVPESQLKLIDTIRLSDEQYVFMVTENYTFRQHGHQWGQRQFYFYKKKKKLWVCVDSVISEDDFIGDNSTYRWLNIGVHKKVLLATGESTGNHHYEKNQTFFDVRLGHVNPIFHIDAEYDNSAWQYPLQDSTCNAKFTRTTFEIINQGLEYNPIRLKFEKYTFDPACEQKILEQVVTTYYGFKEGAYKEL